MPETVLRAERTITDKMIVMAFFALMADKSEPRGFGIDDLLQILADSTGLDPMRVAAELLSMADEYGILKPHGRA